MKAKAKTKPKRGRRSKLTPTLQKALCDRLERMPFISGACAAVGIAPSTFHAWVARGEEEEADEFKDFSDSCARARAKGASRLVREIDECGDWRAKAWILERCFPSEFGRTAERTIAPQEEAAKPIPFTMVLDTGGKTLQELTDFSVIKGQPESPAAEQRSDGDHDDDHDVDGDSLDSMLRTNGAEP